VLDTELIAANAPQFSDSAFLVPKVIDSETEG
jgi:Asp-tRNA(Asn)/Glu-tRNA(Gln) amidotransferase C subunit